MCRILRHKTSMEKEQKKKHLSADPVLYYDYHGVVRREDDSTYVFDARLLLSCVAQQYARPSYMDLRDGNGMTIRFDSVQAFLGRNWYFTYGNKTDSVCHLAKDTAYDKLLGYPRALNDSDHVLPYRYLSLPMDTSAFRKSQGMTIDLGYVNPVSGLPVLFKLPSGCWPAFVGGYSWLGRATMRNGALVFENNNGDAFSPEGIFGLSPVKPKQ